MKLLSTDQEGKTPFIATILFSLAICIYFIIIWLYFGEFNWSKNGWLVVSSDESKLDASLNPYFWILLLAPIIVAILFACIIRFFVKKWIGFDTLPLSISLTVVGDVVILTGLIHNPWSNWIVLARVAIVFISFIICLLILNKLINFCIIHSRFGVSYFSQQYNEIKQNEENNTQLKKTWEMGKNNKKKFIEIPVESNKSEKKG